MLFSVTPWPLTIGYDQARVCIDKKWYLQEKPGKDVPPELDYGEFGKFVCPCPAHPAARRWVVEGIAEVAKKYPIDGCPGHTNGWSAVRHGAPITRAVIREVNVFDSVTGVPPQMAADKT